MIAYSLFMRNENFLQVKKKKRILTLDVIRGIAILGILIMNIQSFSMVGYTYRNPTVYGDLTGINLLAWLFADIFARGKFVKIFSMLFGAGVLLITNKAEEQGTSPAFIHFSRNFWLLIFGIIHAYFLWYGDVLVNYALCSIFVFWFRKISAKKLLICGVSVFAVSSIIYLFLGLTIPFWPAGNYESSLLLWSPSENMINSEISVYLGSWTQIFFQRISRVIFLQTQMFCMSTGWTALGMMLVGMSLFKYGIFTGNKSTNFYVKSIIISFLTGFLFTIIGVVSKFHYGWSFEYSVFFGSQFGKWGGLAISYGYICCIVLLCKSSRFRSIINLFSRIGRMAFTNYILQTLICTTLFYGYGFGLFSKVERAGQFVFVFVIWIALSVFTNVWLKHFTMGPLEWLWRSLTYRKIHKLKRKVIIEES